MIGNELDSMWWKCHTSEQSKDWINIVLNDETDDEGGSYVLGEIERMQGLIISTYGKYLDNDYLSLVMIKLDALKNEVAIKELKRIETINFEKKGRSR